MPGAAALALVLLAQATGPAVPAGPEGAIARVYEPTKSRPLSLYILPATGSHKTRTAVVFFFGGGWTGGSVRQFAEQAKFFAAHGRTAILADYRVRERDGSTPFDSVADAEAALEWVRKHAAELKISPHRIVAAGGSAGGHVALAAAVFGTPRARPDALVLFNPVVDTTETGYGAALLGARARELSPVHHLRKGLPPTIVFHGTGDHTVPFANAEEFTRRMKALGNRCELVPYDGAVHGFFNSRAFRPGASEQIYEDVLQKVQQFLQSLHL